MRKVEPARVRVVPLTQLDLLHPLWDAIGIPPVSLSPRYDSLAIAKIQTALARLATTQKEENLACKTR
jgi:hypothetical protein